MFLKHRWKKVIALIIYVNDMITTGNNAEKISRIKIKKTIAAKFKMKNLEGLKYFLSFEVAKLVKEIFLSQMKYTMDLLSKTIMLNSKPADTLIIQNHGLGEYPDQILVNKKRCQWLVGKLIYLSESATH
jgi:hypothetical protein